MNNPRKTKARFKVGDWVSFPYGALMPIARIIEDRGRIGHGGRQLYRVELPIPDNEPDRFEVAEETLTPSAPPETTAQAS